MVSTSYLRLYQPIDAFPEEERERWLVDPGSPTEPPEQAAARRWLLSGSLPGDDQLTLTEGGFVRRIDGTIYVCPWRTRLRMLASMVAFRSSLPDEVADAFVPETEARRAAAELDALGRRYPDLRSHILHANWHVPLRWFAAFEDSDRILTEDAAGLRIRYEAPLGTATKRLQRALAILEGSWIDDDVIVAVRELFEWLAQFSGGGLLELDYGSVARMFDEDELVEDRSAGLVWSCLEAVEAADIVRAGRIFGELSDRWSEMRAQEVEN
ncbi:MAG TPA: hypothetical protein VM784_07410 [Actinomycetota bacterium]|nr:hypothetical protein [Actinomycetota bacterium]